MLLSNANPQLLRSHLDGDDEVSLVLEEVVGVVGHDPGLVGLGDVGEDAVDHGHEHAVLVRVTGVLDDGHHVGALLRHVDQVAAGPVGELNGVDHALLQKQWRYVKC